ncbi:hypothetical protein GFY24_33745 [Nocardia sp. SYP-A9097]|uniref:hypothetical protein n=1 Tax=Nocardia sp. SYP-A9097 TaxID=2663237 RepID=UPI00129B18A5|nr:hypothetical protein [Nocardia sp. SYP-A9097]MRH92340.1 hypothetical protein [Nocardia sp. SYP-A9097]
MRNISTASTLLIGTLAVTAATATAAPAPVSPSIGYTATLGDAAAVLTTEAGALSADNGVLTVADAAGKALASAVLSFRVDDFVFPITADISARTATLTPRFDLEHATYSPVALPFENQAPWRSEYEREQAAWGRLVSTITAGAAIGSTIGVLSGAAVGCVLGGIAGATVAAAAIIGLFGGFLPAAALGCIGGILAVGALGTIAGQLLVTAPVILMAAAQYFTTITQPAPAPAK